MKFVEQARAAGLAMTHFIHDRDGMYVAPLDQVFKDAQCRVIRTAPQAPTHNAFVERWVKSIKIEMLRDFIVFGQKHFDYLVASYLSYYHEWLPHQGEGIGNRPLIGVWPEVDKTPRPDEEIVCIESNGGILKRYDRRAVLRSASHLLLDAARRAASDGRCCDRQSLLASGLVWAVTSVVRRRQLEVVFVGG